MSKLHLVFLAMVVSASPVSAADVTGTWAMTLKADWTAIPQLVCRLSQKDQEVTGRCSAGNDSDINLDGGKVEGDRITWRWKVVTPDGEAWTYTLTGTVDTTGTTIKGSFTLASRFSTGEGSFIAAKK